MFRSIRTRNARKMNPKRRRLLQYAGMLLATLTIPSPLRAAGAGKHSSTLPQVSKEALADSLSREFSLPPAWVRSAMASAVFQPSVIRRMQQPYEARPYREYRPLFVNPRLERLGKDYLHRHRAQFAQAQARYGVQPQIIAAVLGMETHFGRSRGTDRVLDALYTLAAGYPQRSDFFRKELGHFLALCYEEGLRPQSPLGSYAGAFGTTQFIPSSYRSFAVDADGDGKRDVWDSPADIIHSVAHYFHQHRWDSARPVAFWLPHPPKKQRLLSLLQQGTSDWQDLAELRQALPHLPKAWRDDDRVSLVELDADGGRKAVLVHYNFYVITRWNRSYNYAMAVTELAGRLGCHMCRTLP